ncbi:hypothetical protein CEXT_662531 [Caerostris extrusa]|uniref:Uncharacterized protein n=1 Tax=Caerostris extrusa TaxID=172846 RepID=A0AAV4VC16_CAEEX|nr:hypothetical protein CEXT_662531 [Caerostris extrusa]
MGLQDPKLTPVPEKGRKIVTALKVSGRNQSAWPSSLRFLDVYFPRATCQYSHGKPMLSGGSQESMNRLCVANPKS